MNHAIVNKYTADKDAKWGAKSKNHIWFGFKRHVAVDMRHGLISKFDCKESDFWIKEHGCFAGTIRKNNYKTKKVLNQKGLARQSVAPR